MDSFGHYYGSVVYPVASRNLPPWTWPGEIIGRLRAKYSKISNPDARPFK